MNDMQLALAYLAELETHNDRDWYRDHKAEKDAALAAFEDVVTRLMLTLGEAEPALLGYAPKDLIFRLARDMRYSKGKPPYNPALRALIGPRGKKDIPCGYFICLRPFGRSCVDAGFFEPGLPEATERVRRAIERDGDAFESAVRQSGFPLLGETLKRPPRGFDPAHPHIARLMHKSWYLEAPLPDEIAQDGERLPEVAAALFARMRPMNEFINKALYGYQIPEGY